VYRKNTASQFVSFQGVDSSTGGIKSGVTWTVRRCIDGTFAAGGGTVTEDSTNGWYKYAMSQADTNGNNISFNFTGSVAVPQTVNIVTTAADPTDVVRFGLSALPNVAQAATGTQTNGALLRWGDVMPAVPVANTIDEALFIADNLVGRINTAAGGGASSITLDASASATDGRYVGYMVYLYGGTGGGIRGVGQERTITAYNGTTKVATVAQAWGTNPDNTSKFMLYAQPWTNVGVWNGTVVSTPATAGVPDVNAKNIAGQTATLQSVRSNTAAGGGAGTLTLDAGASALNDFYKDTWVYLTGGTGVGQTRLCTAYNGTTKIASVYPAWVTNPDNTSTFAILPNAGVDAVMWYGNVLSAPNVSGIPLVDSGYFGGVVSPADAGYVAVDWRRTTNRDATVDLSATTIATSQVVASVTGNVGGSVASVAANGITAASLAADAITAAKIADGAIDNATFAADVGSTAVATNVIGIAAKKGVVDALNVDTYAEPGQAAPAATTTLIAKIGYLFKAWRNKKTQTATTFQLFADDTTTVDQKAAVSDDGTTTTVGEIASGP
jgi:hypothetical protein